MQLLEHIFPELRPLPIPENTTELTNVFTFLYLHMPVGDQLESAVIKRIRRVHNSYAHVNLFSITLTSSPPTCYRNPPLSVFQDPQRTAETEQCRTLYIPRLFLAIPTYDQV